MTSAFRAALLYFTVTFAIAFALGTLRTVFVAPALGEVPAVAMELPMMLAVSWWACGVALKRSPVGPSIRSRAAMGAIALILLLLAEAALNVALGGLTLSQHLARYLTAPVLLGLTGQMAYGMFPLLRR